ncbi:MAG: AraC family transcriptional regulator [Bacteroidota bacterium]
MNLITEKDHKKRIERVLDFILKNLNSNISLDKLSEVANYSPFHFQKLFKEAMGETPKQYIIKLRLETALHKMIIHSDKAIQEIAMDCGFSSPAVFSRSVKNLYGMSPEEFRTLSHTNRLNFFNNHQKEINSSELVEIHVKKIEARKGVYLLAPFNDSLAIKKSFQELFKQLTIHELEFNLSKVHGIISPHQGNIYKTFIELDLTKKIPKKFIHTEIKGGKYACFEVKGDND